MDKISASTQKLVCIYLLPVPAVAANLSVGGDLYISKYTDLSEYGRRMLYGSVKVLSFWRDDGGTQNGESGSLKAGRK